MHYKPFSGVFGVTIGLALLGFLGRRPRLATAIAIVYVALEVTAMIVIRRS